MKKKEEFSEKILPGITGFKEIHWKEKLAEVKRFKIEKTALFLERFEKKQREKIYQALSGSQIKEIPLAHIRNDMKKEELKFLFNNFGTRYFTIHEDSFRFLRKWRGFYKYLFLEMDTNNFVSQRVKVERIGGFCVDLAHFKISAHDYSEEFEYLFEKRKNKHYFACNHLNGYSFEKNTDLHLIKGLSDFDYLTSLPKFLFGKVIALETDNSIFEQLKFKKYLVQLLNNYFRE